MWLLLAGCSEKGPPTLEAFDDLSWFDDLTEDPCALSPTLALWGGKRGGVQGIAADASHLYVGFGDDGVWWALVVDPVTGATVGSVLLPRARYVTGLHRAGDWLFVASGDAKVQIVDVSDPTAPAALGTVDLGGQEEPTRFAAWGDRVYTDGGTALYVDLSDPAAPAVVPGEPHERIDHPVVVGDDLLGTRPVGDGCLTQVFDAAGPTLRATFDTDGACLSTGLVALDDGAVIGVGLLADAYDEPGTWVARRLANGDEGWTSGAPVALPFRYASDVASTGRGAVVLGNGNGDGTDYGSYESSGAIVLEGDPPTVAHGWWPDTYYRSYVYFEGVAGANDMVWVTLFAEADPFFEGLVALEPGDCR